MCKCCSCDPNQQPYPDPYCREFDTVPTRQCDTHLSPGRIGIDTIEYPVSVQVRLAGGSP